MTKIKIKKLQEIASTPMEEDVVKELLDGVDNDDELESAFENTSHGCSSGSVSGMIYYEDTLKFYEKHKKEIGKLMKEIDGSFNDLQGWDDEDPLALDTTNQNILAWFGFEETARSLRDRLDQETRCESYDHGFTIKMHPGWKKSTDALKRDFLRAFSDFITYKKMEFSIDASEWGDDFVVGMISSDESDDDDDFEKAMGQYIEKFKKSRKDLADLISSFTIDE